MRNHVRIRRKDRGWTQADLGDRLGVSRQTVNAIEAGRHDPSLSLAFRLAAIFDESVETLFEPEPEPAQA